jgi:hypothetical protein
MNEETGFPKAVENGCEDIYATRICMMYSAWRPYDASIKPAKFWTSLWWRLMWVMDEDRFVFWGMFLLGIGIGFLIGLGFAVWVVHGLACG